MALGFRAQETRSPKPPQGDAGAEHDRHCEAGELVYMHACMCTHMHAYGVPKNACTHIFHICAYRALMNSSFFAIAI